MYIVRVYEKDNEVTEYCCFDQKTFYLGLIATGYNHRDLIDDGTLRVKGLYVTDNGYEINLFERR